MRGELFELVMNHDPNLIFVKDPAGVIVYANKAFLGLYPPERRGSVVGTTTIEHFSDGEVALLLAEDRRAMAVGHSEMVEEIVDFEGRRRVFLTRKIAMTYLTGELRLLGISSDITELADRERTLVEVNDRLARVSALAAHDLRSPLASIVSALEVIRHDRNSNLSPRADEVIALTVESARGLADQVTTLVQTARAEHRHDLDTRLTDLNLLVEEVRFNLSSLIERTNTSFNVARLPSLKVDPNLFRQLLQNLIENSIKHRATRPPFIVVRHSTDSEHDVISVEDNGTGILRSDIERAFRPFEQGEISHTSGGVGLGLDLCRRVVSLHDGSIEIDPAYDEGCRIVLRIPRQESHSTLVEAA